MEQKNTILPSENGGQKSLFPLIITIAIVVVVSAAGIFYYNKWSAQRSGSVEKNIQFSRTDINGDFQNGEAKTKGDTIPPQSIVNQYQPYIDKSLAAIKSGKPSKDEFKDLKEDYLTVAQLNAVLGNYSVAEGYYLQALQKWPDDYKFNMNLGDLYILMGRYKDAANKFYDTIQANPKNELIWQKLSDLYAKYAINRDKADIVYQAGLQNVKGKLLLSEYARYLEDYKKDYPKAIEVWREYEKIAGSREQQEIDRLEKLIK